MSEPKYSPWGKVQYCEEMYPGVFDVSTAGHGGIMVKSSTVDSILSPAAQKCGFMERGYLNFEEDCQANVVERELLDKGLWDVPPRYEDKADYEEMINDSLQRHNPEYWQTREQSMSEAASTKDKPGKPSLLAQLEEKSKEVKPPTAAKKDGLEH